MIDFTSIVNNVVVVAVTWLLHSTILLSSVWLSVRLFLPRSWGFRERLWRCAAVRFVEAS